jgi:hypothetical protein
VSSLPEVMGANPGDLEQLGEAGEDLQQALVAEQEHWWEDVEPEVRRRHLEEGRRMEQRYARSQQAAVKKLTFSPAPGDQVLLKQLVPGKGLLRATGPYTVLRLVARGAGAEIINSKGRIVTVAKCNLRPFRAPAVETVTVGEEELPPGFVVYEGLGPQALTSDEESSGEMDEG